FSTSSPILFHLALVNRVVVTFTPVGWRQLGGAKESGLRGASSTPAWRPTRHKGSVVKPSPDPRCSYRQAWTHDPRGNPCATGAHYRGRRWAATRPVPSAARKTTRHADEVQHGKNNLKPLGRSRFKPCRPLSRKGMTNHRNAGVIISVRDLRSAQG